MLLFVRFYQRPTAEDLVKLKYIKSHAKTSLHHLNELLVNLEAWKGKGNQRISLAPGVGGASIDDSCVCGIQAA